jgi:transcriptional regulator with XRE-family HTH domain/tetratricopeptide (TPR) repeat protein
MSNSVKTLGEAIRARRKTKLLSQEALADLAGIKLDTLRDIEAGKTRYPHPQTIQKIARALGCDLEELGTSIPAALNRDMLALTSLARDRSPPNDCAAFLVAQITRTDLMMDRRAAIKMTFLAGASLLNPVEGWLWEFEQSSPHRPVRFAPERHHEIEKLEDAARTFRKLSHGSAGSTYRKPVVILLKEVSSIFEDNGLSTAIKERLYRVMADLGTTAAEISWDCGLERQAQEYYGLALHCAYAGGDFALGANVLAGIARQMLCLGHPQDALDLVRLARQRLDRTTDPRLLARLDAREAWAFTALARVPAFQRATMQAREHIAAAPTVGGAHWIADYDDADISGVIGARLMELARHSQKQYAENAFAALSHPLQSTRKCGRDFAIDQIALAECCFLLGDTTAAVEETDRALNALEYTQSRRPLVRLGELFQQARCAPQVRAVVDVQGRIRDTLKSRQDMWV